MQQTEEAVCRVGGITCNAEGFAGETGAVDVLEGGERDTNLYLATCNIDVTNEHFRDISGCCAFSRLLSDCKSSCVDETQEHVMAKYNPGKPSPSSCASDSWTFMYKS